MPRGTQGRTDFSDSEVDGSALAGQLSSMTVQFSVDTHDTENPRLRMHVSNLPASHTEKQLLREVLHSMRGLESSGARSLQHSLDMKAKKAIEDVCRSQLGGDLPVEVTRVDEPCSMSPKTQQRDWEEFKKSNPSECNLTTWYDEPMQLQPKEIRKKWP